MKNTPPKRNPLHTSSLTYEGYQREDGMFEIEGLLVDTKPFDIDNHDRGGQIKAGEPLHQMRVRIVFDASMCIHDAEASTDWAPFDYCYPAGESFQKLIGVCIAPGWNRRVRKLLGGIQGCTHITEMLGQLGTVAYQSTYALRHSGKAQSEDVPPPVLNSCHSFADDSPVVKRLWPGFYTGER